MTGDKAQLKSSTALGSVTQSAYSSNSEIEPRALMSEPAARYCGSTDSTFRKKRMDGTGPKFIRLSGNRIAYLREDLDDWLNAKTKLSTTSELEAA